MTEQNIDANYSADLQKRHDSCDCRGRDGCVKTGYRYVDVSVPVEIKPDTEICKIEAECCGEPTVCCKDNPQRNACEITLVQKLCLKISVRYDVCAKSGEGKINCACDCDA